MATTNALKLAKEQFKGGTLKDENREALLKRTKANIEAAGGDREEGLRITREQLKGATAKVEPTEKEIRQDIRDIGTQLVSPDETPTQVKKTAEVDPTTGLTPSTQVGDRARKTSNITIKADKTITPTKTTPKATAAPAVKPITNLNEFKAKGSTVKGLAEFLENSTTSPASDIQIKGNRVTGVRDGERFEWTIDSAGNPIRKSLGKVDNEQESFAKTSGMDFTINDKGQTVFNPSNLDEAIDLFSRFGDKVKINKKSTQAIKGTSVWKKYNKYIGASSDTYLEGLKAREIAPKGETWNRLVKMNGGQLTPEMIEARDKFELDEKTNNNNENSKDLFNAFTDGEKVTSKSTEKDFKDAINKKDKSYIESKVSIFDNVAAQLAEFKKGTPETNALKRQAGDTARKIDSLRKEKATILSNLKRKFPKARMSTILKMAQNETSAINEEIFVLGDQYNTEFADYQDAFDQDKAVFEANMTSLNQKSDLITQMYGIQRGDLIRGESVARQDRLLSESITRAEDGRKQAIIDNDIQAAKNFAYQIKLAEAKQKMNSKAFQALTPGAGVIAVFDPSTGEVRYESSPTGTGATTTDGQFTVSQGTTQNRPDRNNNPGNLKMGDVGGGVDDQGHTIFSSATDGFNALVKDLNAKKTGNTRTGLNGESTLAQLGKVYAEDPKWGQGVSRLSGISLTTKLKDIDMNKLAPFVAKQEGFSGTVGAAPTTTTTGDFTQNRLARNNAIDLFLGRTKGIEKGIDANLVNQMGDKIEQFRTNNIDLVKKFEEITGESSKTSDKEQVKNFNRAIGEAALGDGDTSPIKAQIRRALLGDKIIADKLETSQNIIEGTNVIEDLVKKAGGTGLSTRGAESIAKTIGRSTGEDITSIDQITGKMLASYVKSISGVAVSEEEYQRLADQLPSIKDSPERFMNLLTNFKTETVRENTVRAKQALNDDALFDELFPKLRIGGTIQTTTGVNKWKNRKTKKTTNPFSNSNVFKSFSSSTSTPF